MRLCCFHEKRQLSDGIRTIIRSLDPHSKRDITFTRESAYAKQDGGTSIRFGDLRGMLLRGAAVDRHVTN